MSKENLTDEQRCLLANYQDLTQEDRQMVSAFIEHILKLSLVQRSHTKLLREYHIVDYAQRPVA